MLRSTAHSLLLLYTCSHLNHGVSCPRTSPHLFNDNMRELMLSLASVCIHRCPCRWWQQLHGSDHCLQ
jgi:hypothetical protein